MQTKGRDKKLRTRRSSRKHLKVRSLKLLESNINNNALKYSHWLLRITVLLCLFCQTVWRSLSTHGSSNFGLKIHYRATTLNGATWCLSTSDDRLGLQKYFVSNCSFKPKNEIQKMKTKT